MSRIALIAGAGGLPFELASAMSEPPLVCALDQGQPEGLDVDIWFSLSRLVPFLRLLGDRGVQTIVLAGAVNRPQLDPESFDSETASLLPDLLAAMQGGDDGALRWIISLMEDFDFTVAGVPEIAPHLLVEDGVLTARGPTAAERADALRGRAILSALDPVDVGQGCAVASGLCLGIETIYGTDALLNRLSFDRPDREPQVGGVFIKRAKADQDIRADLPTIGAQTVVLAGQAQLSAICLHADHVILLDRARLLQAADEAGIAIWAEA